MRFAQLLPALALVARGAAAQQDDDEAPGPADVEVEARRFIIEFASGVHAETKRDKLSSEEGITVLTTFESAVFSGASLETDSHNLDTLRGLPDVVGVWPSGKIRLLAPVKRQTGVEPDAATAAAHAVHWATGVDELHAEGVLGEGVKVGIVDTGVWYRHAALGGGFGPGFKVAGGWDLVGDDWALGGEKRPDADPADEQGHGTHCAGILAGEETGEAGPSGWKGVAPRASLYAYKVFGPGDGTDEATIIDAFLRAYDDGMDVITASVGGRGGFAENAWAVVANRIAAEGVVVTVAAGNSGSGGAYYANSGSAGENVLAVASAEVKRGSNATTTTTNTTTTAGDDEDGAVRRPSYFTSWGGLYDLSVKPDIAAPGTDVFSTWPGGDDNQFALLSGTSMATPYVAGVAALYISKHGGRSVHGKGFARDLTMRIVASGASLPWLPYVEEAAESAFRAPSQQVGGGLIDARKVVGYDTALELRRFGLNDTANFRAGQEMAVRNTGADKVTYSFAVESWAGVEMLKAYDARDPGETPRIRYRPEIVPSNISVDVALPDEFELGPGEERKAKFEFEVPQGVNQTALPAYGGRVLVKGSNGEVLGVPFQGLAFDLKEQMQSPFHGTYPWLRSTAAYSNKTTFTFDLSSAAQDFPKIFMKIKWGTREVRWDIYESAFEEGRDWEYPPVPGRRGYIGSATSWTGSGSSSSFNPARHNASDVFAMPERDVARNALTTGGFTTTYWWFGRLADGNVIGPGNYTMRFAVLIPFADPRDANSWKGLTTQFTVLPKPGNETVAMRWG
ncbi:subtilase [Colletotrichum graminicola]|uniref:Subtilase n=1 Tax=Colletotrichum graminicola (strain M1.001 / M2 / FGSC 10212) TaxID=645133 RepID=E3Q9A0_COLGM|nr:subtilase [Colletotrichum graminicola M1.001]EFQ27279.1 subtilase [Colletotrichum graminicola M1.001]WDK13055.1 subtilase [Colletotrichum graminicola]